MEICLAVRVVVFRAISPRIFFDAYGKFLWSIQISKKLGYPRGKKIRAEFRFFSVVAGMENLNPFPNGNILIHMYIRTTH